MRYIRGADYSPLNECGHTARARRALWPLTGRLPSVKKYDEATANFVASREGPVDHLEFIIGFGLQLQNHASVAHGIGFEHLIVLAATMNVCNQVTRTEGLNRHKFGCAWIR